MNIGREFFGGPENPGEILTVQIFDVLYYFLS